MSRTLTVHSDGTARGTVVLTDDGEVVGNVTNIDLSVNVQDGNTLTLEVRGSGVAANVQANLIETNFYCAACGEYCDHECEGTLSGKSQWKLRGFAGSTGVMSPPVTATQGQTILPFNVCGEFDGLKNICHVRAGLPHMVHFDVSTATSWNRI